MIITRELARDKKPKAIIEKKAGLAALDDLTARSPRIGLALSGGGFRAAIFHLGVIRRLEELGIMPRVRVVSAVSGGSIISAYYLCEMERRLRFEKPENRSSRSTRVRIFEEIAHDFFQALDNNLRTRALIFTPFYYPWLFIKTLILKPFRAGARSELIQREYDRWFYKNNSLDQLPSAEQQNSPDKTRKNSAGPRLHINTTSLLTGERVAFSREPISNLNEMSRVNTNILPLSRVVGASSGVPGLFPPTMISGDVLVDGGVADNQGIESLIEDPEDCNLLLVSDASGQMEPVHTIKEGALKVMLRVNSIFQFQIRNKLLDILVGWKRLPDLRTTDKEPHEFAFIHLHLNLKDCHVTDRIPSEFIPGIARIRTDLDQFSPVERESLMYHGYTLIDAQMKKYCNTLLPELKDGTTAPAMATPPLFKREVPGSCSNRDRIRAELKAGSQNSYLARCLKKHPFQTGTILTGGLGLALACLYLVFLAQPQLIDRFGEVIAGFFMGLIPDIWVRPASGFLEARGLLDVETTVQGLSGLAAILFMLGLIIYLIAFPLYLILRRTVSALDRRMYKKLTGVEPSTRWISTSQDRTGPNNRP
ncbi:patatin-like phospholipase family protein [Desulfonatronovibrio hydrogenovorans]|uniref:patatin-like phospholipase family protein n=1 Tax=Desulfonatronovibrio hydrogenovorans TaxID=53245 RepID=UPI00048F0E96|nr:patatin-like phospholipase family protein [Desulfonatronovibrio hydrogenovorans]